MNTQVINRPRWTTASISSAAHASATELSALGAHYAECNGCRGRLFTLRCLAEAAHGFVAPRMVTTLVVVGAVFALASML